MTMLCVLAMPVILACLADAANHRFCVQPDGGRRSMTMIALMLAVLAQDHFRGPVADDDGTGAPAGNACPAATQDAIVVCRRAESDRLGALPDRPQRSALRPAVRLPGGGEARAEAIQHDAGITSVPAAMVTLRIPLGSRKKKPAQDDH
jgi:hypothetical protein